MAGSQAAASVGQCGAAQPSAVPGHAVLVQHEGLLQGRVGGPGEGGPQVAGEGGQYACYTMFHFSAMNLSTTLHYNEL